MNIKALHVPGYVLELENNLSTRRVATYIGTNINYKRRMDLEMQNGHMIVIDFLGASPTRMVDLHRPFKPQLMSEF